MEALNWLDLIIVGLVFIFGLKGLSSGLIRGNFWHYRDNWRLCCSHF